jgi:hypothetical protein
MTADFNPRQALRDAYDNAPVDDDPRIDNQENGRDVLVELPAPRPHRNPDDASVKLPLRVVHDGCSGLILEIGPYDFDDVDIHMLKQAIAHYEHHGGKTWPLKWVPKGSPEGANPRSDLPRQRGAYVQRDRSRLPPCRGGRPVNAAYLCTVAAARSPAPHSCRYGIRPGPVRAVRRESSKPRRGLSGCSVASHGVYDHAVVVGTRLGAHRCQLRLRHAR